MLDHDTQKCSPREAVAQDHVPAKNHKWYIGESWASLQLKGQMGVL